MASKKTPAPSGCKITRNGSKFTLSWKIAAKNSGDGQKTRHKVNGSKKWSKAKAIGKKAKSTTYIPKNKKGKVLSKVTSVRMEVQDNQKKASGAKNLAASSWVGATFKLARPPKPIVTLTLDNDNWNRCLLSWGHKGNKFTKSDNYWYIRTESQTIFHSEKQKDSWPKKGYTKRAETGSFYQREDSLKLSTGEAYVRKFRFRILGHAGYNEDGWVTCAHYYSTPYKAIVKAATMSESSGGVISCTVKWYSGSDTFHPIDETTLQYGIAVPSINMSCPSDISWVDRPTMKDTPGKDVQDGDSFLIDTTIDADECLFVRVVNIHDLNKSYSAPKRATGIITMLSAPENLDIDPDFETYRAQIGADNASPVPDSNIAIIFKSITNGVSNEEIIGILPHGVPYATFQCPNWDAADEWSFGAFAFVGDYGEYIISEDTTVSVGKNYYSRTGTGERTATIIENPTGNPHENGYYEDIDGEYFITEDTVVIEGKSYYTLSAPDPYVYSLIKTPTGNPHENGYYELSPQSGKGISFDSHGVTYTYNVYEIPNIKMKSVVIWQGGDIPRPPANVKATSPREGVALVTWDWAWESADIAELSWSDHEDAWESTDQPEVYRIQNTHAAKWSIYGLATGTTWYIRVRLIKMNGDIENAGPWSSITNESTLDMSSAPNAPALTLSKRSTTHDSAFTVSWEYSSTDGTDQKDAVLISATINENGEVVYGEEIVTGIGTNRSIDIIPDNEGWQTGEKYGMALKVVSESDRHSLWSNIEFITIAEPLSCNIVSDSFVNRYEYSQAVLTESEDGEGVETISEDAEYYTLTGTIVAEPDINNINDYYELVNGVYSKTDDGIIDDTKTYYTVEGTLVENPVEAQINSYYDRKETNILKRMPIELAANISGGLETGYQASISIERAAPYFIDRPDETTYSGYIGETVYSSPIADPANIKIEQADLIGYLDDTASYILRVYAMDELDQTAQDEIEFTVNWEHQSATPGATVEFDSEYSVIKITPSIDPEKFEEGDTFDIYRLSVDKPTLIVKGGQFGETYVDPYPTIGRYGGHRVVTVTANGDFISNDVDTDMAWIDLGIEEGDYFYNDFSIINSKEGMLEIPFNADLSTTWSKDFKETRYLGGHIQGDWNAGVSRTSTINSVSIRGSDDFIVAFRRIAEYPGVCHIRTLDGANYYADIQGSSSVPSDDSPLDSYTFNITRVDSDGYDGIELSEWNKIISG